MRPCVADLVAAPRHGGPLAGAPAVGHAAGAERLVVEIGLWLERDRAVRARFRATTCASLIAYAEAACAALEAGADPARLDAAAIRGLVSGVHPVHRGRADLVAAAVHAARTRGAAS